MPKNFKAPFVWNYRENLIKRVCIYFDDASKVISIDKCTEGEEYIQILKRGDYVFRATVRLSTEGTKIISVT